MRYGIDYRAGVSNAYCVSRSRRLRSCVRPDVMHNAGAITRYGVAGDAGVITAGEKNFIPAVLQVPVPWYWSLLVRVLFVIVP